MTVTSRGALPSWWADVQDRLETLIRDRGDDLAVVDPAGSSTYAALDRTARDVTIRMRAEGVSAGDLVPLLARPRRGFFAQVLAAWGLGAVPLPLHATAHRAGGPRIGSPVTGCQPWKAVLSASSGAQVPVVTHGEAPSVPRKASALGLRPGGVALFASPLHLNGPFEWSVRQLLLGGTVVLAPRFDPVSYLATARRHRPTWAFLTPFQMRRLIDGAGEGAVAAALDGLELLLHSSQPCPPPLRRRYERVLGAHRVVEYYGAAEYDGALAGPSVGAGWFRGRPIAGVEFRAVDSGGSLLAPGVDGLLQARSTVGLVAHALSGPCSPRSTWTGIGDRGYIDRTGVVTLTSTTTPGRAIVGGVNVALARVRGVLLGHGDIEGCDVQTATDPAYGEVISVQVRARPGVTPADLRRHCAAHLGPGERPHVIRILGADAGERP